MRSLSFFAGATVTAAALAFAVPVTAQSASAPAEALSEPTLLWGQKVTLRDGVKLNATVYRPRGQAAPLPCVLTMTPYVAGTYHAAGTYFAARGYVFAAVDVRGRGNSEGDFDPLRGEADDAYDTVEWLAAQPWCNGKVAMWGGSYGGYVQWAAASRQPPHLVTLIPTAAPYAGLDFPYNDSVFSTFTVRWLTLTAGRTLQDRLMGDPPFWSRQVRRFLESGRPFNELDRALGNPSPVFQAWVRHPAPDAYWDALNPTAAQYAQVRQPVLTVTGFYDTDQSGSLEHYRRHLAADPAAKTRHFLVIGPWDHGQTRDPRGAVGGLAFGPASKVDVNRLNRDWYDWTLKGGERPAFLVRPVTYYVAGAETWRGAETLEAVTREQRPLYLASGRLEDQARATGADAFVHDPLDLGWVGAAETFDDDSLVEIDPAVKAGKGFLAYDGAPLAADTEVAGFFKLDAWIALDQPDADLSARVYAVAADGSSILLTRTLLRARYRDGARRERLATPGKVEKYVFDQFPFVARTLPKGTRLRLVVGPNLVLNAERNFNGGGVVAEESARDARTVTVRLFHDRTRPSALYVPLGG